MKREKIVLWNGHNRGLNGNLLEIYRAMKKRSEYRFIILSKQDLFTCPETGRKKSIPGFVKGIWLFFVALPYHMATAQKVFFNDNFLPLGYMKTDQRETQFIQLWHGAGAFKRFGLSTETDSEVFRQVKNANQRITHLFVTSSQVVPFYQEAFAIEPSKIHAVGIPMMELYFDQKRMEKRRQGFYQRYPELKGKKLLLYVPTFRKESWENDRILQQFDVSKVHAVMGEEWMILVKLHPRFPQDHEIQSDYCYDMSKYQDVSDLFLVADLLITDYSSAVVEYVLLDKPVILYAYDLSEYDRGFYFQYEDHMPGEIAHDQQELMELLGKKENNSQKRQNFVKFQYDNINGKVCDRILDILG